jgi:hypothetical protein
MDVTVGIDALCGAGLRDRLPTLLFSAEALEVGRMRQPLGYGIK